MHIEDNCLIKVTDEDIKEGEFTVPENVTEIGERAFYGCNSLTNITIPESVTSIGEFAFYDCKSLTDITIPGSVTSMGKFVFLDCTNLTNVTISEGVTSVSERAFSHCLGITNIIIPKSVTSIGKGAFMACMHLTNITIPESVTSIGYQAFQGCAYLTNVIIEGVPSILSGEINPNIITFSAINTLKMLMSEPVDEGREQEVANKIMELITKIQSMIDNVNYSVNVVNPAKKHQEELDSVIIEFYIKQKDWEGAINYFNSHFISSAIAVVARVYQHVGPQTEHKFDPN